MDIGNQHQMAVLNTFPTGAQEWHCPTCGRRFILQRSPHYKRIILDDGDAWAIHFGGSGGMVMGDASIQPEEANHIDPTGSAAGQADNPDDPYLSPWENWLKDQDL